ncbi:MAG TPA: carbonic anhydrase [Sphingomonadales bacterium]|nr:carbonic anhydrase [Sphingomonadales bacterium]
MIAPKFLKDGYRRFRESPRAEKIRGLAGGQRPKVMVIACSDARVHPATIFDAHPGELFMVRNVANIVPPCETGGTYHGTSAALEFAVKSLNIPAVLVLGHSGCGGVKACLDAAGKKPPGDFIGPWVAIMAKARGEVLKENPGAAPKTQAMLLEKANVKTSLANLATFPFVTDRVAEGRLQLLGAWFDIKTAGLEWVD